MPARVRDKPRGVLARCPASPLMPMNAPRGIPLRNAPAPANAPEPPPDRTHAACPFALQRPSLILSQSHVYAACPEQWPRARPSPPGPSARTPFPSPAKRAAKKPPQGADRPRPMRKDPSKAACGKSARPFPWPAIPAAINERLFAPQKKRAFPGRRRILLKANAPVPPHRGPPRERLPSPANRAAKKAPWEPTDRLQRPRSVFPLFALSFPEHRREWACALGRAGPFRLQTRRLAHLTLLSRAKSAQPGALGMPANANIALIYKNQVRFCFPGWRTFSTPVAPLTALPRAPRCRVRG